MKFTCDSCHARYQIPDEKVAGRRLRYTCRKCSNVLVLDGSAIVLDVGTFDVSPSIGDPPETTAPLTIPPSAFPAAGAVTAPVATAPAAAARTPKTASVPEPAPKPIPRPVLSGPGLRATSAAAKPLASDASSPVVATASPTTSVEAPASTSSATPPRASAPPPRASVPPPRASVPPRPSSPPPARASVPPPLPPAEPETPVAAPALPELPIWHVAIRGTPVGPLRLREVAARAELGDVTQRSLAWCEGQTDWLPIAEIAELAAIVPTTAAPLTPAIDAPAASAAPALRPSPASRAAATTSPRTSYPPEPEPEPEPWPRAAPSPQERSKVPLLLGLFGIAALITGIALYLGYGSDGGSTSDRGVSANASPSTSSAPTNADPGALSNTAIEDVGDDTYLAELAGVSDAGARTRVEARDVRPREDDRPLPMPTATTSTTGTPRTDGTSDSFETHVATTPRPAATGPLEAAQISAVVRANRSRAQRCYERAATMSGSAPDVRLSVTIRIATSGTVSDVDIQGNDFGGVIACVQRIVSSWQFPASTTGGQTTFSLVFAGG